MKPQTVNVPSEESESSEEEEYEDEENYDEVTSEDEINLRTPEKIIMSSKPIERPEASASAVISDRRRTDSVSTV